MACRWCEQDFPISEDKTTHWVDGAGDVPCEQAKIKMIAILHDGTLEGDNAFYCPNSHIEYKKGQTFEEVKQAFLHKMIQEGDDEEMVQDMWGDAAGAWVVTEEHFKIIGLVWEADPGNDSAVYMCNYIAKKIAVNLAVIRLGKDANGI